MTTPLWAWAWTFLAVRPFERQDQAESLVTTFPRASWLSISQYIFVKSLSLSREATLREHFWAVIRKIHDIVTLCSMVFWRTLAGDHPCLFWASTNTPKWHSLHSPWTGTKHFWGWRHFNVVCASWLIVGRTAWLQGLALPSTQSLHTHALQRG